MTQDAAQELSFMAFSTASLLSEGRRRVEVAA